MTPDEKTNKLAFFGEQWVILEQYGKNISGDILSQLKDPNLSDDKKMKIRKLIY